MIQRILPLLLCASLATLARAESETNDPLDGALRAPRVAIGPVVLIGEDHPSPDLADFPVHIEGSIPGLAAEWLASPVRWLRANDGLPVPRARLRVFVAVVPERILLHWRGRAVAFQASEGGAAAELFVPLLDGGTVIVDLDGKPAAKIRITVSPRPGAAHAIDHSCSPWELQVSGLDDTFLSANCRMMPVGRIGSEEASLEVRWAAAGVTLPDGSTPPHTAHHRSPACSIKLKRCSHFELASGGA